MEMKILEVLTLLSASDDELDENSKELKKEIKEKAVLRMKESEKIQKAKTEVPFSKFKAYLKELNEEEKFIRYKSHYNKAIEIIVKMLDNEKCEFNLSDLDYELWRAQMLEEEFGKLKWIEKDEFSANAKIFNTETQVNKMCRPDKIYENNDTELEESFKGLILALQERINVNNQIISYIKEQEAQILKRVEEANQTIQNMKARLR